MRLATLLLASTLLALAALPALAATYKTPKALLQALYAYNTDTTNPDAPSPYQPFFSDQLNRRFKADRDHTPDGEEGAIDFDPVISGQDGTPTHVSVGQPIVLGDKAEVEVDFKNGGPVTLHYSLVREHGGWKVDDIANQGGDYPWSLSALFDAAK